ncbi:bifunctional indole-3-glycerol-phosphate synthase TrpC/phosphoribosylanthranilate isomerase TrpF [Aliivibrio finisterrensis]|uniref:bifunctional indole-3-glycerol-phosphate synthase TrpC/phosphoribosylanthranilate isomerase TrpF n=1 Tax=Aliivibrio finisterrensis TaxID=511998 RepID=UPI0010227A60|nr:bifunctional indole-3-glycerol-phosphate synthase TrpC/phosphoribosylanthranilate isomerase TrpF [Aliivibrio finisterrensis]RYU71390.1 bifunctional indole-3-glycerol-phosphate synthase TrpC/phosphoribosylanthranilate isomerase TrpF [Aliivibrio finisterrensis]RYU75117.1 bifunctional indole-3-glycerol-phosphate synthase TrpC/phosphoribosylanthranilate isomerase TrpF [Aliivibrio finisterrensis]RYU77563.1 bifunctional indole-3-glycerol-phosphate synthase TrpC/phosphoribosylanthranilate isomerase 
MTQQLSEHISVENTQMAEVLVKIVKDKAIWISERKESQPLDTFKNGLTNSDRSFYDALKTGKIEFILECKKASPSKGLIRQDFDLNYIASVYNKHASAISVLTDEKYFQGSFDFLPIIRDQVNQPILCKDFMIDAYQVYLARHYGADAILLMLSVLNDEEYKALAAVAHSFDMGILTEVSNEEELHRAVALEAQVIGINNRNLRDLSTDLNRTKELAPLLPKGTTIISESGIYTHQQVKDLAKHATGFLIGSSLMAEENLELAARKVILGENKVCGLTSVEDAKAAYDSGAVYGGLIFVEKSPRFVSLETAKAITQETTLHYVGVFQNETVSTVAQRAHELSLAVVQLHGSESEDYIAELKQQLPASCQVWNVISVSDEAQSISLPQSLADKVLVDCKVGSQEGGTGISFDWNKLPHHNIMLAGGLSLENTKQAAQLGCYGLDFNSGVESAPGKKDHKKLRAVFSALRDY